MTSSPISHRLPRTDIYTFQRHLLKGYFPGNRLNDSTITETTTLTLETMLTQTYVNLTYFFYPIGNTPAVNLLRDIHPAGKEQIDILSLACGDIRNVLFTLASEGTPRYHNTLHFTLCDYEPAVLARNLFLFTFLIDHNSSDDLRVLWNIYYHLYITTGDFKVLQRHASDLLSISASTNEWCASHYGKFSKFVSDSTLRELRRFWILYAKPKACDEHNAKAVIDSAMAKIGEGGIGPHASRAAGLHGLSALNTMISTHKRFWKTGVVAGNSQDVQSLKSDNGGRIKSLFALSSAPDEQFSVHYSTDPLQSFHLAQGFDGPEVVSGRFDQLAQTAKTEFKQWCRVFLKFVEARSIILCFHCGDAVDFCHELQVVADRRSSLSPATHVYNRPWSYQPLILDTADTGKVRSRFDIIDTSNVMDHLGILSILSAVSPLLRDGADAILYTESLHFSSEDTQKTLEDLLCSDVTTLYALVGVAPLGQVFGVTTEHYGAEISGIMLSKSATRARVSVPFRVRIPWKRNRPGKPRSETYNATSKIQIPQQQLAKFLFNMYLAMFSPSENISLRMAQILKQVAGTRDRYAYSRVTLVSFLNLVKKNVDTDWECCIASLVDLIERDRTLILATNNLQELYIHLHISGLWVVDALDNDPRQLWTGFGRPRRPAGEPGLLGADDLSGYAHLILVVPRVKLRIFIGSPDKVGSPGLHLSVFQQPLFENSFYGIDAGFGTIRSSNTSASCAIEPDPHGWKGGSDLIVTCVVPIFPFLVGDRRATRVALCVDTTVQNTILYSAKLGPTMQIYHACLGDTQNLWLCRQAPNIETDWPVRVPNRPENPTRESTQTPCNESVLVSLTDDATLSNICIRKQFFDDHDIELLIRGEKVEIAQHSPTTIRLEFGSVSRSLVFPCAIKGSSCRTRITRKQRWIEVIASPSPYFQEGGEFRNPFSVFKSQCGQLQAASLGRTNLDLQPEVKMPISQNIFNAHLGMTLSHFERTLQNRHGCANHPLRTALVDLKQTIGTMLRSVLIQRSRHSQGGMSDKQCKSFMLSVDGDCDVIILAHKFCHDFDTGSVVLDAYVVFLTNELSTSLAKPLQDLHQSNDSLQISLTRDEEVLWKNLMPAFIERCRYTWDHMDSCRYRSQSSTSDSPAHVKVPLSIKHGEQPCCACGEGKDTSNLPEKFSTFHKMATRIAVAPLSAVPYVELLFSREDQENLTAPAPSVQPDTAAGGAAASERASLGGETCSHCGKTRSGLKACARCGKVKYCNHDCQKAAWKTHKKVCKV